MSESFLKIESVSKSFGNTIALDNVSLDINKSELFSLLGSSGCGKSTLLRIIAGFEKPDSGKIYLDGEDITSLPPYLRPLNIMFALILEQKIVVKVLKGNTLIFFLLNFKSLKSESSIIETLSSAENK